MSTLKKMLEVIQAAEQRRLVRKETKKTKRTSRAKHSAPVDRVARSTDRMSTAALEKWTAGKYLAYLVGKLGREVDFKTAGKQLAHMKAFLQNLDGIAPRSILRMFDALADNRFTLVHRWKLAQPFDENLMLTKYDLIMRDFGQFLYSKTSLPYLLTEDTDVEEVAIEKVDNGWNLTATDTVVFVSHAETDRILNPRLKQRLSLFTTRQADDDLPLLE